VRFRDDDDAPNAVVVAVLALVVALLLGVAWWGTRSDARGSRQADALALVTDVWSEMNHFDRDHWCDMWWHDRGRLDALVEDDYTEAAWHELLEVVCPPLTNA